MEAQPVFPDFFPPHKLDERFGSLSPPSGQSSVLRVGLECFSALTQQDCPLLDIRHQLSSDNYPEKDSRDVPPGGGRQNSGLFFIRGETAAVL